MGGRADCVRTREGCGGVQVTGLFVFISKINISFHQVDSEEPSTFQASQLCSCPNVPGSHGFHIYVQTTNAIRQILSHLFNNSSVQILLWKTVRSQKPERADLCETAQRHLRIVAGSGEGKPALVAATGSLMLRYIWKFEDTNTPLIFASAWRKKSVAAQKKMWWKLCLSY